MFLKFRPVYLQALTRLSAKDQNRVGHDEVMVWAKAQLYGISHLQALDVQRKVAA